MTSTRGPVRSTSRGRCVPSASAPTIQSPASLSRPRVRARLVTVTTGVVSAAPAATLRAVALSGAARSRGTIRASTPQASAVRRQAPRLWGSCTPSSASSSGFACRLDRRQQLRLGPGVQRPDFCQHALVHRVSHARKHPPCIDALDRLACRARELLDVHGPRIHAVPAAGRRAARARDDACSSAPHGVQAVDGLSPSRAQGRSSLPPV